jgi:hypothetical protein
MVVNETVETYHKVNDVAKELDVPLIFLNRSTDNLFSEDESSIISRLSSSSDHPLVASGEWRLELELATRSARERLEKETAASVVILPDIPHSAGEAGVVSRLSDELQDIDSGTNKGALEL